MRILTTTVIVKKNIESVNASANGDPVIGDGGNGMVQNRMIEIKAPVAYDARPKTVYDAQGSAYSEGLAKLETAFG